MPFGRSGYFGPIDPSKKVPHTVTRGPGAVSARSLLDRSWTGQNDVPVLGPEDQSHDELAATIPEVIGRESATSRRRWTITRRNCPGAG